MYAANLPALTSDRSSDGKAMACLSERERLFVIAMLQQGLNKKAAQIAASEAGYTNPVYGYELMRRDNILAAMREEATKRVAGAALLGISGMLEIAANPMHKDQYKACKDLAALNGFTAEQRIVVEHIDSDSKAMIQKIRSMADNLGVDAAQLIASAGIVDAEYTVVNDPEVDTSDW